MGQKLVKEQGVHGTNVRIWYIEGGVHPYYQPMYLSEGKMGDPSKSKGDATRIPIPDPNNFNRDVSIGTIPGTEERATLQVMRRYLTDEALLLRWLRQECRVDIFAMIGVCGNPQDFQYGGEKFVYFLDGIPSTHNIEGFGAFGLDETNPTNETLDMTAEDYWEVFKIATDEVAAELTTREVMTVDVCDNIDCGDCGDKSDGCSKVFATMVGVGATPGTEPLLIFSDDGGETFASETITTMFSSEGIADAECIGADLVLISNEGNEFHYRDIGDLLAGVGEWNQQDNGFVVGGEPNYMSSSSTSTTWVVGDGGYIYFAANHRSGVVVQDAGIATTENLHYVHALNANDVLVVGENNTVLLSRNGGTTWQTIVGPAVGENLGVCWMWDENVWFVGTGAGGSGVMYKTQDGGHTWDEQDIPLANVLRFDSIKFVSDMEGYLTCRVGGNARALRTITGGFEWWEIPDARKGSTLPAADYHNDIAVCQEDSNTVFLAGMDDDGTTGILIKGAPAFS